MMTSLETQARIRDALLAIAAETDQSPASVIADAMIASVTVLVATGKPRHVDALYRQAVKLGHWTKAEMQRDWTVMAA